MAGHVVRSWYWWLTPFLVLMALGHFFTLSINFTQSLPNHVFVVLKYDRAISRGDYVAFLHPGGGPYPPGAPFVKIAAGVPGDTVQSLDRMYYVNGRPVGQAKQYSKTGMPLRPGPTGVLPDGFFYVYTPNPDSFDSRYDGTGWIHERRFVGRAIPLF